MRNRFKSIGICTLATMTGTAAVAYVALAQAPGGGARPQAATAMFDVFRSFIGATDTTTEASAWVGRGGPAAFETGGGNALRSIDWVAPLGTGSMAITAHCLIPLMRNGQLDREATIQTLLPEFTASLDPQFRTNAANIRVRHLIRHMSGIDFDSTKDAASFATAAASPRRDEAFARISLNRGLSAAQDSRFILNNVNYAILGMIIKRITGQPYEAFCIQALGLPATARIAAGLQVLEAFGGWEMSVEQYAQWFVARLSTFAGDPNYIFFMQPAPLTEFFFSESCATCAYGLGVMVLPVVDLQPDVTFYENFHHGAWSSTATTPNNAGFFAAWYANGRLVVMNYNRNVDDRTRELLETSMRIAAFGVDPPSAGPPPAATPPQPPPSTEDQIRSIFRN